MDKSKWEYRNFEKCIEKIPHPKQLKTSEYNSEGRYPIISQEETLISGYSDKQDIVNHFYKPVVIFGDHTRTLKYIDFDFIVGADGVKILIPKDDLIGKFLFYYLKWYKIPSLGYSRHYKLLKEISVPIPPFLIQQDIVSELDQLSAIISLKQQQMREYDALAQSLFYEMFGDPLNNNNERLNRSLNKICLITSSKRIFANEYVKKGVPFYRGKEITELSKGESVSEPLFISKERYEEIKSQYGIPRIGDILVTAVGTIGNIWVVNNNKPFYFKDGNIIWLHPKEKFDATFFRRLLTIIIDKFKDSLSNGAAYKALTIQNLGKVNVNLPPLSLQRSFAEKVKAIEHQKSLLKQSIAETQTLLDSRMQEYFG